MYVRASEWEAERFANGVDAFIVVAEMSVIYQLLDKFRAHRKNSNSTISLSLRAHACISRFLDFIVYTHTHAHTTIARNPHSNWMHGKSRTFFLVRWDHLSRVKMSTELKMCTFLSTHCISRDRASTASGLKESRYVSCEQQVLVLYRMKRVRNLTVTKFSIFSSFIKTLRAIKTYILRFHKKKKYLQIVKENNNWFNVNSIASILLMVSSRLVWHWIVGVSIIFFSNRSLFVVGWCSRTASNPLCGGMWKIEREREMFVSACCLSLFLLSVAFLFSTRMHIVVFFIVVVNLRCPPRRWTLSARKLRQSMEFVNSWIIWPGVWSASFRC